MWGLSGSFAFLVQSELLRAGSRRKKMALASGIVVTLAMLGGAVAQSPMQVVSAAFGWRNAMLANGVLGILIILLMFFIIKDYPTETACGSCKK